MGAGSFERRVTIGFRFSALGFRADRFEQPEGRERRPRQKLPVMTSCAKDGSLGPCAVEPGRVS
jgi:hypothetical protein